MLVWAQKFKDLKKDYTWNPATYSCENGEHVTSSIDDSVVRCDEIANVAHSVSTTNGSENVTSTAPTKFYDKIFRYKMDCCIWIDVKWIVVQIS